MKIVWQPPLPAAKSAGGIVVQQARIGWSVMVSNQITVLNLRVPGLGTRLGDYAALRVRETDDEWAVGLPAIRLFEAFDERIAVQWAFLWGVVLNRAQKGRRPRGEFIYVVVDCAEVPDALFDLFGLDRWLDDDSDWRDMVMNGGRSGHGSVIGSGGCADVASGAAVARPERAYPESARRLV